MFIRTSWFPPDGLPKRERVAEAGAVVNSLNLPGTNVGWFALGRSKREALAKAIDVDQIELGKKPWRLVPLVPGESYTALDIWNGLDGVRSCNISVQINEPPCDLDRLVLSGPELPFLRQVNVPWESVLDTARGLAERLGGVTVVSSHELIEYAVRKALPNAKGAAHAVFWGKDRSGHNELYRSLKQLGAEAPFSQTIALSWEDVTLPNQERLESFLSLLQELNLEML